ncbi:hypothetical protein ABW20_dc0104599 [Dactylellina cionopaga]|nr:hypothetical protein ABW20_dc0104599 [Dactylellina cionopaga]
MRSFLELIIFGALAFGAAARSSSTSTKETPTAIRTIPIATCTVRMYTVECPHEYDPCCDRLCLDTLSNGYFCADKYEGVAAGIKCDSCVLTTSSSSSSLPTPTANPVPVLLQISNSTTATTTVSVIPEPTFASGASTVNIGGAAVMGFLGLLFTL